MLRNAILIASACSTLLLIGLTNDSRADLRIRDVCHVKGQEENTLHGMGLVVGLQGTGDDNLQKDRTLAQFMEMLGGSIAKDATGQMQLQELKDTKNVALVFVAATIPAQGAREGDSLDCTVSAVSAKSLQGGVLLQTALIGPRPGSRHVYAIARGALTIEGSGPSTTARVNKGCRVEEDLPSPFHKDGKFTLVLKSSQAGFNAAFEIEETINSMPHIRESDGLNELNRRSYATSIQENGPSEGKENEPHGGVAFAVDTKNIEVKIPSAYRSQPIAFIDEVLDTRLTRFPKRATVLINERTGVIIIGEDVEIRPVGINHKNLSIEPAGGPAVGKFIPVNPSADTSTTKLLALVNALNALRVPTTDQIDIIKSLESSGDLYGELIIE